MINLDTIVVIGGIVYGLVLIMAAFVRTRITDLMRVDILFMSQAGENTRPLNLFVGLLIAGYGIYSLLAR